MRTRKRGRGTWLAVFAFLCAIGFSDVQAEENGSSVIGATLYHIHCASCHGESGRGDGLVGKALRTPPADLTTLAAKNGGIFPEAMVSDFIDGTRDVLAHGPRTMPVWGMVFQDHGTIHKIVDYLRDLQRT